jgi:hypothetical protein
MISALPTVDDTFSTEVGVILMGLDAERLLAGLYLASLAVDPTIVTLLVDRVRHGAAGPVTLDALAAAGVSKWRAAAAALDASGRPEPGPAPLRQAWSQAFRKLGALGIGQNRSATTVYLTACWLRREDIGKYATAREQARGWQGH